MKIKFTLAALFVLFASFVYSADAPKTDAPQTPGVKEPAQPKPTQEELDKKFAEMMNGVTLQGHYTSDRGDSGAPGKEDQYDIESVSKLEGEFWLFKATIKYGDHNVTVPLPLRVVWAGDTPIITLDNFTVPGFGAFTARVMIFDGRYAGMWDGHGHGGVMVGKIVKRNTKDSK